MKHVFIFVLIIFLGSFKHPLYLSVTDLKYNPKEQAIQGSVKLFINDAEDALKKLNDRSVDLVNPKDTLKTNKILSDYLKKRLVIKVNNEIKNYELIGFEKEQEAIWLYIEAKKCASPKKIEIENSLLYDFLKDQMNIVHMEVNGDKKSSKVNCPEKRIVLEF